MSNTCRCSFPAWIGRMETHGTTVQLNVNNVLRCLKMSEDVLRIRQNEALSHWTRFSLSQGHSSGIVGIHQAIHRKQLPIGLLGAQKHLLLRCAAAEMCYVMMVVILTSLKHWHILYPREIPLGSFKNSNMLELVGFWCHLSVLSNSSMMFSGFSGCNAPPGASSIQQPACSPAFITFQRLSHPYDTSAVN